MLSPIKSWQCHELTFSELHGSRTDFYLQIERGKRKEMSCKTI